LCRWLCKKRHLGRRGEDKDITPKVGQGEVRVKSVQGGVGTQIVLKEKEILKEKEKERESERERKRTRKSEGKLIKFFVMITFR